MNIAVIIPAAGSSRRYRADSGADVQRSKLDEDLGGRPVIQRTVELFTKHPDVSAIVVAGPADESAFGEFRMRHGDKLGLLGVTLCRGGAEHRYQTVHNALQVVFDKAADATHVAVHDAARPCVSPELIERVFTAAASHGAVIPGLDVPDTLKRVSGEVAAAAADPLDAILGGAGKSDTAARLVEQTIDRRGLVLVQTPQVFAIDVIRRAYAQEDLSSTDDAQLVERLGEPVAVVKGDPRNIKITRPADLPLVRAILGVRAPAERAAHKRF